MKTGASRMFAVLLSSATIAARPARAIAQDVIDAQGRYAAVAHEIATLVEHERRTKGIPAISVSIVDGQRIVWAQGFGWADSIARVRATASTIYRVGSVSKLFTDIAIMRLVEKGALSLDAGIQRYLPDFHPANPFGGDITIRELTSHRAGPPREPPVGNYFDDTSPSLAATVASLNHTT